MSRVSAGLPVFDRLLDDDPGVSREAPRARGQTLQELKQAVRRDLEHLLNSRQRCLSWEGRLTELAQSLVNYGLPDFTGAVAGTGRVRLGRRADHGQLHDQGAESMSDDLLAYYNRELSFPRHLGAEFAAAHPKIAGRLRLGPHGAEDRHVERLLEAVAYLNARPRCSSARGRLPHLIVQ